MDQTDVDQARTVIEVTPDGAALESTTRAIAGPPSKPELDSAADSEDGELGDERETEDGDEASYTIDDLAGQTGVPSRTIRFYQAKGALPPPIRRGRVAFYGPEHVERLKLVAELQDRGLHLKAIRDLVTRADAGGMSVSEWLGLGEKLRAPWTDDRPRVFSDLEMQEVVGDRRGVLADLKRLGLVRTEGDAMPSSYFVKSPGLLTVVFRLVDAGVDLEVARNVTDILRKRVARAADELIGTLAKEAEKNDDDLVASLEALRGVGLETVRLVFAQEMERAVRELVERGDFGPKKAGTTDRIKARAEREAAKARVLAEREAAQAKRRADRAAARRDREADREEKRAARAAKRGESRR